MEVEREITIRCAANVEALHAAALRLMEAVPDGVTDKVYVGNRDGGTGLTIVACWTETD